MKAVRENVEVVLQMLQDIRVNHRIPEFSHMESLQAFLEDCKNWLPPERCYDRVMEHKAQDRKKLEEEKS